ncbi:OmpA family protein [Nubsella zeaxanthinifaciens]|uniref:OmpA family protein n=1 Tax=Nubsella zeaxanthinifaciens TaxID=392412 RepID=UPI000DE27BB8|nr:OmpA family protein [Nubsella zeaxanthinifaciens]
MKRNTIGFILFAVIFWSLPSVVKAQFVLKEADAQFELYNYEKAIELYTQAYQKKKTVVAAERLAECYKQLRDFKQAASWYAILTTMKGVQPEAYKSYAEMLRANSMYGEAKEQYARYNRMVTQPTPELSAQIAKWLVSCDSAASWMERPKDVEIYNLKEVNSAKSDWAAVVYNNGLVFTSDRDFSSVSEKTSKSFLKLDRTQLPNNKVYGWTGNGYLKLFQKDEKGNIQLFPINISGTGYHIGSATFSADEKEVYFTLSRIPKNVRLERNVANTINIEIYSSKKNGDTWSEPVPFRYNNVLEWSVGDPFLSADGKQLYFVSDMPGGKGGTDIYVCNRTADGKWGAALNLFMVNSIGNERTPFVQGDMMYFSSDAGLGMGGLDIFKANAKTGLVTNLGYPFNSPQDDFGFRLTGKLKGYFSSNREGGNGSDDIYSFIEKEKPTILVQGKALDKETGKPLTNALITLRKAGGEPIRLQTDAEGNYQFNVEEGVQYEVTADKRNYRAAVINLSSSSAKDGKIEQPLYLVPIVENMPIRIENIFYDFNKANIRKDAAVELDKLVTIMKENPTMWIEISSHTDSRGDDQLNMRLSQARANAVVKYLASKGINKIRMQAKGYGESMLINNCANGVKCSIQEHQLNRRTEFKIIKQ